jgi:hypothetical protein
MIPCRASLANGWGEFNPPTRALAITIAKMSLLPFSTEASASVPILENFA